MKKMGAVGLLVFLLVVSIVLPFSTEFRESGVGAISETIDLFQTEQTPQYDPEAIFRNGTIFDDFSSAIQVDPSPRDFALGDADGDGLKDFVAVISDGTDTLSIYNRSLDGTLSTIQWRLSNPAMQNLRDIAVGDLDEDGMDDIVVSHTDVGENPFITILFRASDYSTTSPPAKRLSLSEANPYEVQIGKFNDTVHNAIAVVCRGTASANDDVVNVYRYPFLNTTFRKRIDILDFTNSQMLAFGDINGDGRIDLAVGNKTGSDVCVLLQPPTYAGTWTSYTKAIDGQASDIELMDVMGLGRSDLVFADAKNSVVYVYKNTGAGFEGIPQPPVDAQDSLSAIALGEISEGPGVDLITLSDVSSNASVFFRNTEGSWYGEQNLTFPTNYFPVKCLVDRSLVGHEGVYVLSTGRSNRNGSLEFFISDPALKGNANSNLIIPSFDPGNMASGTMANGNVLIAAVLPSTDRLFVYEYNSGAVNTLYAQSGVGDVVFGAFDEDGSPDAAVVNLISESLSFYRSAGILSKQYPDLNISIALPSPTVILSASLRNDTFDDVVVGCDGGILIFYNTEDGGLFSQNVNETLGTGIPGMRSAICVGDFNNDTYGGDIAVLNSGTSTVELYFRNPAGVVGSYYMDIPNKKLTRSGASFQSMAAADFGMISGGSRLTDVAVLDHSGVVYFYEQPSYGFTINFTSETRSERLYDTATDIYSNDLNDDGLADFSVCFSNLPSLAIFLRDGDFSFRNTVNFTTGGVASDLLTGDVDGDGRQDMISSSNESRSLSFWIQNNLAPLANATASDYAAEEGTDIIFDGSGSADSYSDKSSLQYYWSFGDGDIDSGLTAIHRFLDNGTYGVSLRVTDRGGLTNYSNITVTIGDALPTASFTPPQNPVEGVQAAFTDTSTSYPDQIVSWTWEFGDGTRAYTKDATHVYMQDRSYTVNLTVVDEDGSDSNATIVVDVADVSPRADFIVSNLSPLENTTVYFDDTSHSYPDSIASREWTFGDGSVDSGPHVSHVYLQNGSYNVTLTIRDSDGSVSTHWETVQVQDSVPIASFEFSPTTPLEGQTVYFVDESSAHDGVDSWHWDFGDGNTSNLQTPSHEYGNNGTYDVTLIVSDGDGSTSQKTLEIIVQDTSPTILTLTTSSGLTSFDEDEIIIFRTNAIPGWESVKRYEWNFTYSNPFVPFSVTIINHTSHSYPQEGAYSVLVRVWDSDSYSEKILPIEIENVRPIANFSYSMSQTGEVMFDASISSDTPSDVSSLQFRWNFGDGTNWSPWYSDPVIRHTFVNKSREYSVVLNVRDDDGEIASKAMPVIVDTTRPVVFVLSSGQGAVVGAPITISATVTDDFGIYNVTLHYKIGDEVRNVTMSQSAADIYEGQIPSQNSSVTIFFWIQAFDNSGNSFTTGEYEIIVQTTIPLEYWYGGIGGLAMLAAGLFLGIRRYYATVDEAFIIYEDGRLIAHQTRHLKPGMDDDVLSSMLVAIQDFVKDSFKDERATALKRLDFGEKKILVEKGDRVYLAAVLHGKHAGKIPQKMLHAIEEIQKEFGPVFAQWDGNLEDMRGVKDKTQPLFKKKWTISIKRFAVLRRSPNEIGPLMIECPICDQKIPAYSKRCPSCGVDLSNASVDDLEQVAQDMLQDETSSSRKDENTEK